jgi:predicted nucleic acid-binding protein
MPNERVFVDTNILVYAHDDQAGDRHEVAQKRLRELVASPVTPAISAHVLHELYVTLVRRGSGPSERGRDA